ncbi:MAG TPA: putative metal-binding motif-containing protein [Kofleriaceae bacterium]|nr:putative metal-binding motif-containing protein [Kofleriaceae bacterium]
MLTVRAPDGPSTADRLELVLASADARSITAVDGQRASDTALVEESVRYYRQRATAGTLDAIAQLDGFVVRIAPDTSVSADEAYVPFLVASTRDPDGSYRLTGIGAVLDAAGDPAPVTIADGVRESYFVDVTPLVAPVGTLAAREGLELRCPTPQQSTYRSGLAWRFDRGPQLRLLLPDVVADPAATDARERALDLDCDHHDALVDDCDDLRAAFHDGAAETCDGMDTNCDGDRYAIVDCALPAGVCGPAPSQGLAICDELSAQQTTCAGDPQCQCTSGNPGPCTKCILAFEPTAVVTDQRPCAPAVGKLAIGCTEPCTVEVMPRPGNWGALVAAQLGGTFAPRATGVTDAVFIQAALLSGSVVTAAPAESVGDFVLAITHGDDVRYLGVDLQLSSLGSATCPITNGTSPMLCSP